MIKKGSVFAGKKGPLNAAGFATPVNISSTSSSFFDNSLPHMPPTGLGAVPGRNWQATPMNSHRFPPHHYQQQSQSSSSIRVHPTATLLPTPSSTMINRVKPHSLQGLVENLNELLAELAIPFVLRYDTKYGFEDILSILDHLTNPSRYVNHRFQPFPPLPQPTKPGGKLSLTDRWSYLKQVLLLYRLSTFDQLSRIKPERNMGTDQMIVILECFIQLATCLLKSEQEQERIAAHHYLSEFKALMRQMFWIGRHDPSVMEEAMHELRRHCNGKDQLELLDRLEHEKQMSERTKERDQLKVQADEMKVNREEAENQCSTLTAANESMLIELTKKQEEFAEEQSKFNELTQIVEQKDFDKKHLTDRNQFLSDKLFAQQTDVELQRHLRSNTELKQQHEVLLSTLLLEQQLHSSAANEHKQLVKDLQDTLSKYQILLSAYKHKAPRVPSSALDFDLSDIIGDATSNISNDAVRQAQNALETLIKEITAEEILLTQRHRDLEQESKQKIEELQAAEREWKSAAKHGQRRAAQQNELSRFQQEIRSLTMKIADFERKIEEKKAATIDLKKESDRIKTGIAELLRRFEVLETNYLSKEEELRDRLNWFINDHGQLAKIFRRDVEEIKRMQQEHLTKLEMHSNPLAFDDLVQSEIQKLYHYQHVDEDEDEDDDDDDENRQRWIGDLEKVHDEHLLCLKKKKKEAKVHGPVIERLQELYENLHVLDE